MTEPEEPSRVGGIDPTLLTEAGRASAAQDQLDSTDELIAQGQRIAEDAAELVEVTRVNLEAENRRFRRRNNVLLTGIILLLLMSGVREYRSWFVSGPQLDRVDKTVTGPLSDANRKLDQITAYIEAQQARADAGAAAVQVALAQIDQLRPLICASEDPVRLEACGQTPPPTTAPPVPVAPRIPATTPTSVAPYLAPTPSTTCPTLPNDKCRK